MDRGAWRALVHGVTKSQTQLSAHAHRFIHHLYVELIWVWGSA